MQQEILEIIEYLDRKKGRFFCGARRGFLEGVLSERLSRTGAGDLPAYLHFLKKSDTERNKLCELLTVNVSHFFRHPMTFEFLKEMVLPVSITNKKKKQDFSLRVWSAGCACGEEIYSYMIILNEFLQDEINDYDLTIFGTDINNKAIQQAQEGCYGEDSVVNVKYSLLLKYFEIKGQEFRLSPRIKNQVQFAFFDLLDRKTYIPRDSIYGNFDFIFCCNVLIYFMPEFQRKICANLYRALAPGGYLILGQADLPHPEYADKLERVTDCSKIYRKKGKYPKI